MNEALPSILIVEDEYLPGLHLKTALGREGHAVYGPATTAQEALEIARQNSPDLVLMDIRLAGAEDGIEAAKRIRESSEVAIIFMSGYQEQQFKDKAMALKPLAFLVKPVLIKDIKAVIARWRAGG